jgi:hypothetical protein
MEEGMRVEDVRVGMNEGEKLLRFEFSFPRLSYLTSRALIIDSVMKALS